jgi:hypothetical protein
MVIFRAQKNYSRDVDTEAPRPSCLPRVCNWQCSATSLLHRVIGVALTLVPLCYYGCPSGHFEATAWREERSWRIKQPSNWYFLWGVAQAWEGERSWSQSWLQPPAFLTLCLDRLQWGCGTHFWCWPLNIPEGTWRINLGLRSPCQGSSSAATHAV